MSTLWIAALALAAPPVEGVSPSSLDPPAVTVGESTVGESAVGESSLALRSGPELREAVREALQHWARPSDEEADQAAAEFLTLYGELQRDRELASSQREEFLGKVRGRLMTLSGQICKRVAIEARLARQERPESVDAVATRPGVLAQLGGFGGGMMGGPGMGGPMMGGMMNRGMMGGGPMGGGMQNDDNGQELVELIQQTIAPTTWDVNGGTGTIYYWRPGRAIVVRQQEEIHRQIGDVIQQLEKLNR
ncbi:MAG TPA: hypothetical protein VMY42_09455 [Thermoguttaceae bacterium]|nr:hypothetical protein [Thermoguttaceae bacterium]